MKTTTLPLLCLLSLAGGRPAWAADPQDKQVTMLCGTNPAYSLSVMRAVLEAQLQRDHDPSLDGTPPDQLAEQAVEQGITECADAVRKDMSIYTALSDLSGQERQMGWDAYNTACSDRPNAKGACISAEVGAVRALKHMVATDTPPGARALVQGCQLVLKTDPAMTEWRVCVDQALAVHASAGKAASCKMSVSWHVAKTGGEAGKMIAACLSGG